MTTAKTKPGRFAGELLKVKFYGTLKNLFLIFQCNNQQAAI